MLELNFEVEPEDPGSTYPYPDVLRVSTPTNRSYAPPGWYMLFIYGKASVTANNLPSVAIWVKLS